MAGKEGRNDEGMNRKEGRNKNNTPRQGRDGMQRFQKKKRNDDNSRCVGRTLTEWKGKKEVR